MDYLQPARASWASVDAVRNAPLPDRLRSLVAPRASGEDAPGDDNEAAGLLWHTLSHTLAYASKRLLEIADSPSDIDNAMKWGFGWEMGPFETWDALGVAETVARMEEEGVAVAPWVKEMLEQGHGGILRSSKRVRQTRLPPLQTDWFTARRGARTRPPERANAWSTSPR